MGLTKEAKMLEAIITERKNPKIEKEEARKEVIIHRDVLVEDARDMQKKGQDITAYKKALEIIREKKRAGAIQIPYQESPEEAAQRFNQGDKVRLSGGYGGPDMCIADYGNAMRKRGVDVIEDKEAIVE